MLHDVAPLSIAVGDGEGLGVGWLPFTDKERDGARAETLSGASDPFVTGADTAVSRALAGNAKGLLTLLTVPAPDGDPALCGRARAVELAVNALLPWAAARAATPVTADAILSIADRLPPAEAYGPTRHLTRNLRDGRGRTLISSALKQQGTLALLTEWCRRGGCGRCPLS